LEIFWSYWIHWILIIFFFQQIIFKYYSLTRTNIKCICSLDKMKDKSKRWGCGMILTSKIFWSRFYCKKWIFLLIVYVFRSFLACMWICIHFGNCIIIQIDAIIFHSKWNEKNSKISQSRFEIELQIVNTSIAVQPKIIVDTR